MYRYLIEPDHPPRFEIRRFSFLYPRRSHPQNHSSPLNHKSGKSFSHRTTHTNRQQNHSETNNMENMEFENFICHADFSKVLQLADRLKYENKEGSQCRHHGEKDLNSFESTAVLIRSMLITSRWSEVAVLGRGECRITDSLIDETINSLAKELKLCLAEFDSAKKFSKRQTDILTDWMTEHRENPYPTHHEICVLGKETNLSNTQVVNWTTNVRKRNLKGTAPVVVAVALG